MFLSIARSCLVLVCGVLLGTLVAAQAETDPDWPVHSNNLTDVVQWDHYSFMVNGQRLFVFSGELHYWRIPVPELWVDILEKIKAAGFTAVAFYSHWGFHSANPDHLDFESGARDFTKLYPIAKDVGLYVIARPGPYVNAETNAGGLPGWLTTGAYGALRNNDSRYTTAYTPFWEKAAQLSAPYQITSNGSALLYQIENEYSSQWIGNPVNRVPNGEAIDYMQELQDSARKEGIVIPTIQNAPNMNTKSWSRDWSSEAGNVDVYGLDSYPSCWSCNLDECTATNGEYVAYSVQNYYRHFQEVSPTQPSFMPEFQGGSYNPWGGPEGGCPNDIGTDFANMFYRHVVAERVTAISLYMMYGGTNWGGLAAPVVATSYDYSSPISENRALWDKFYETKNLALFTRVAEDLTYTERLGNSTSYTTNPNVMATELRNSETNAGFYVVKHSPSYLDTRDQFRLHVQTSVGNLTVPQGGTALVLDGHQAKILVTDFRFGGQTLVYSTAEVLTYAVFEEKPAIVLWVPDGESGQFYLRDAQDGKTATPASVTFTDAAAGTIVSFTQHAGLSIVDFDSARILIASRSYAYRIWVPPLTADPLPAVDQTVLIHGPYLVRSATLDSSTGTLHIKGDVDTLTTLEVFGPSTIKSLRFNNQPLGTTTTPHNTLIATLAGPPSASSLNIPSLSTLDWKYADSLPEISPSYDASGPTWVLANNTSTPNPYKPDTLPVLYADDYGFHYNSHIFRGTFVGEAEGVYLAVQGGTAFGWSAWVNGDFIGSYLGSASSGWGNLTLSFSNATLNTEEDQRENVLTVVMDNTGHDQRSDAIRPRGIAAARLLPPSSGNLTNTTAPEATISQWKIAGNAGGSTRILDPVRGPLAEGAFVAERQGWHLPGYPYSESWPSLPRSAHNGNNSDLLTLSIPTAGVSYFTTSLPLDIPSGLDVALAFTFSVPSGSPTHFRAQLFVNGYQYGKINPFMGNQKVFPVPVGVLDYAGENRIGVLVWNQGVEEVKVGVKVGVEYVLGSALDARRVSGESVNLRPGWTEEREEFA